MSDFLKQFFIKDKEVCPALVLAPMSGVTNSAFRRLIKKENPKSVGLVVTEFISIEGLTRENQQSLRMMNFAPEERPISVQIFGYDISRMVQAAQMVEAQGADIVDINSGCPVPKVVKRGGGCELMRQPEHLKQMLRKVRGAVKIPLTLKIRAGWDEKSKNAMEIAKIAEGEGIDMLAVHGRTRAELYRGNADWQIVSEIAKELKIPVVGSGDVLSANFVRQVLNAKVSGVMIGRGALANPWIFSEIYSELTQGDFQKPSDVETAKIIATYRDMLKEDMPDKAVIGKLKQFSSQVTRRVPGSAEVRKQLCTSHSLEEFNARLSEWKDKLEEKSVEYQTINTSTEDTIYA